MRVLGYILLVTWIATFVRTIFNLRRVPRLKAVMPARTPLVSVIVPARNEEAHIERTVRALLAQTYPAIEVIVIDDHSIDRTGEIVTRLAAEDARVIAFRGEDTPAGWLGKTWALHQGSLRASGHVLLFVDADVYYAPEAVAAAVAYLEESGVPMIALLPRIEMRGFWEHLTMPNLSMMAFVFMPLTLANRTRSRVLAIGAGTGNLVRRAEYDAAGGHTQLKDAVVDDVGLARLMRRSGHHTQAVRADDFVSVHMYSGLREIIEGFTKNCFTTFGRNYLLAALLIPFTLLFHVVPYVVAFTGDVLYIATAVMISLTRVVLFSALGYRIDNAIFGNAPMTLIWLYILVRSTWITGIRRQLHWRGRRYDASRTRFGAD